MMKTPTPPVEGLKISPLNTDIPSEHRYRKFLMYRDDQRKWKYERIEAHWLDHPEYAYTHYVPEEITCHIDVQFKCGDKDIGRETLELFGLDTVEFIERFI